MTRTETEALARVYRRLLWLARRRRAKLREQNKENAGAEDISEVDSTPAQVQSGKPDLRSL